jgi:hypothetical protein
MAGVTITGPGIFTGMNGTEVIGPGTPLGTTNLYYDPCAFNVQPSGFLGSEPRNFLRGPRLFDGDFSVVKDTSLKYLGEAGQVEFRAEIFNILNHPNFSIPNATIFSGTAGIEPVTGAGQITSTLRNQVSRQVQLALRVSF